MWLDISSEPKDGTWVLLKGGEPSFVDPRPSNEPKVVTARWVDWEESAYECWVMGWFDGGYPITYDAPTYWTTLPK